MTRREVHLIGPADRFVPVADALREAGLLTGVPVDPGSGPVAAVIEALAVRWARDRPAAVLVDDSGLAAALAAYGQGVPVVHADAGMRQATARRVPDVRLLTQLSALHLAPTTQAAMNLLDEHVLARDILVTGSLRVDAAFEAAGARGPYADPAVARTPGKRLILATTGSAEIMSAARRLVEAYDDVEVIVACPGAVPGGERLRVVGPLAHADLCRLLVDATAVLTDDDAVVLIAPSFGVPALLLDDATALGESWQAGCARPAGADLTGAVAALLDSPVRAAAMVAGGNPYGDGFAGFRAAQAIAAMLGLADRPAMPALTHGAHA